MRPKFERLNTRRSTPSRKILTLISFGSAPIDTNDRCFWSHCSRMCLYLKRKIKIGYIVIRKLFLPSDALAAWEKVTHVLSSATSGSRFLWTSFPAILKMVINWRMFVDYTRNKFDTNLMSMLQICEYMY